MQLDYHQSARDNKVYVVGACGFDSIPADMGTVFLENKFGGQVNSVETYLHVYPKVSLAILTLIKAKTRLTHLCNTLYRDFVDITLLGNQLFTASPAPKN